MSKILLVNTNIEKVPYPVPPLGLCMMASVLEKGYDVKVYDGVFDEGRSLADLVKAFSPDFIGFSIRNIDDVVAERPVYYVERILSDFIDPVRNVTAAPIILGGSGFSMFPEELMKLAHADYGIVGEGEDVLPALIYRLENGKNTGDLPNVIQKDRPFSRKYFSRGLIRYTGSVYSEIDHHIDFTPYLQRGVYSVQTKRGCYHGCIYCTYPLIEGSRIRRRDPAEIADEIERAAGRLGPVTFEFVDSTFNDPKGHAEAICREIIKRKLKVRLRTMGINPGNASEELFDLMINAGFMQIDATPDSASPAMLRNLDKGFELADVQKMALMIRKFNLPTMWFFLFGGPGETRETFMETLDFIDNYVSPEDLVYMNAGMRIYPETPLYDIALTEGRLKQGQSLLYPPVFYYSKHCGKDEINRLILEAAKKRVNCIPSNETTPSQDMIKEAVSMQRDLNLKEPMFRTLLRIRRQRMSDCQA